MPAPRFRILLLRALVLLALAAGAVSEGRWVAAAVRDAWPLVRSDQLGAQRHVFGAEWVDVMERAREAIPQDGGEYLLLDGTADGAEAHWIRYGLSPRRARLVGVERGDLWLVDVSRLPGGRQLPVLLCQEKRAPELLTAAEAGARLAIAQVTREDDTLPAALDVPADGEVVSSESLVVQGWCQELGGRPCPQIHVFLDGRRVSTTEVLRFPRPDVEAAVAGIGSCERAGYQQLVRLPAEGARSEVKVLAVAADGRYRWLGPHVVTRGGR